MRVWDIGEEVVPHADEWARVKTRCLFVSRSSSNGSSDRLEKKAAAQDGSPCQNQGAPSMSPDVTALENALIRGHDDGEDDDSNNNGNNSTTDNNGKSYHTAASAAAAVSENSAAAAKESARCALRSLRPEILRQAGARPAWRTGRVTAVLDRSETAGPRCHPAAAMGTTSGRTNKSRTDLLIEVRDRC